MKQSTFSAVMANSIKNLLQGYTKGIRFVAVLTMLLTMGIGQAWGAIETGTYKLVTSTNDLEAGAHYIIASGTSGSVQCISNVSNSNNRKTVAATVSSSQITVASNSTIMTFTLGGSSGAWTFQTDNYQGTNGYLASAASGSNNYCRVISTVQTATISFSNNAAVITLKPHTSRNILRYNANNGTPLFACYSSGQSPVYLYKKVVSNFKKGETIFIYGKSGSNAWDASACVKAWFSKDGASSPASNLTWLYDNGYKMFAVVVPSDNLNQMQLQRFANDCNTWWNSNGDVYQSNRGDKNTVQSTSAGTSAISWKDTYTIKLRGSINDWATTDIGTLTDQGNGIFKYTYQNFYCDAAAKQSQDFKLLDSYDYWWGSNNTTLSGMKVGSTYNITATLDVTKNGGSFTMSKEFVKGTVHFDLQGRGSAIASLTNVAANSTITAPTEPKAEGYAFKGWYKDAACTDDWVFVSDKVTETMTLYAKWEELPKYTITWMGAGKTFYTEATHGSTYQDLTLPIDPETGQAYEYAGNAIGGCSDTWMGWSTHDLGNAAGQSAPDDLFMDPADAPATVISGPVTFYAVFANETEGGGATESTLSFANTTQRTSLTTTQQVWEQNGITFTNNKGSSTSNVAEYSNPVRCYKNSEIIVEHTSEAITKIVFNCNSETYATALANSIKESDKYTETLNGSVVTITFTQAVASFSATLTADQVRINSIKVTSSNGGGYENYRTRCEDYYSFHTGGADVKENNTQSRFQRVGETTELQITGYTIPTNDTHFFVGRSGWYYDDNLGTSNSKSEVRTWAEKMYLAPTGNAATLGHAVGAVGTLRIFEDSYQENLYVGFIPDGYKLKFGDDEYAITQYEGHDYRSDIVKYVTTTCNNTVSVGVTNAEGVYVATNHTQEMRHVFLDVSQALQGGSWADLNAKFAIYYFKSSNDTDNGWSKFMTAVPGKTNLYEGWYPAEYDRIIFVRINPVQIEPITNWNNRWNQTGNLQIPTQQNVFKITAWDGQTTGWTFEEMSGKFRIYDDSGDKNWYAHFYPHYVLTYDKNNANASGKMELQSVSIDAQNKSVTILDNGFTAPEGYRFVGWNTKPDGSGTPYAVGANHTLSADITLYAIWEKEYTVTYDANGGTTSCVDDNAYIKGETVKVCAEQPTRTGYTFDGWVRSDNSERVKEGESFTMPASNVTLTAQWIINTYNVTLNPNYPAGKTGTFTDKEGNTINGNLVLKYDYNTPSMPLTDLYQSIELDGYKFNGWFSATVGGSPWTQTGTITKNVTVYAQWTELDCRWIETDITKILPEDEVVVTMQIINSNGEIAYQALGTETITNSPKSQGVNVTSGVINPADNSEFEFSKYSWSISTVTGGYTLQPYGMSGIYLYGMPSYISIGNNTENNVFLIYASPENDNKCFAYVRDKAYFVGYGMEDGNGAWKRFTSYQSVLNNQTLKFYKRVCVDESNPWCIVTFNAGSGSCDTESLTGTKNEGITLPTATPSDACDKDGWTFAGWAEASVTETTTAPTLLLAGANYQPDKEYKTLYAVYSKEETNEGVADTSTEATLSFANKAQRTEYSTTKQVWEQNGITLTNYKSESTSNVGDYANPARFYAGSKIIISAPGNITKIVATCTETKYTTALVNSVGTGTSSNNNVVTIIPAAASTTYTIDKLTAQVQMSSLTVTYLAESGPTTTTTYNSNPDCATYPLIFNDRGVETSDEYSAGYQVPQPADPTDVCTEPIEYVFDGWATAEITAENVTSYEKVTFPFTMPAESTTLYAVYRYVEEGSGDSGDYVKVTDNLDDYSGDYLFVYETGNVAFDGGLDELDETENTIAVTISNNTIESNATTDAAKFTIAKVDGGYSIQSASGYFIGWSTADKNGLNANSKYSANYYLNTISNSIISGVKGTLKYNKTSGQERFRYYQSGQEAIALYRKAASYLYTTSPVCGPHLVVTEGKDIYVTGGNAGGTRDLVIAQQKVSYKATRLQTSNGLVDGTAPDVKVATNGITVGGVVTSDVKVTIDQTKEQQTDGTYTITGTITVQYQPSANNKQEDIQVQLAVDYNAEARDNFTVHARSLPAEFVIVAKSGDKWYALNGDMNTNAANPANGQVTLDNDANPTKATYAPCNAIYTFDGLPNTGDRTYVCFQGTDGAWLWAASGTNVGIQNNVLKTTPEGSNKAYNWKLYTEDNITYRFGNANSSRQLTLNGEKFGMYTSGVQDIRILPYEAKCLYNYAPSNLKVSVLKGSYVVLTWDAVVGATNYQYSTNATTWTDAGTEPTVTINGLTGDTEYTYYIRAYHEDAGVSQECIDYAEITFTTADCDDVPTNITYTADLNSITVSWTAAAPTATIKLFMNEDGTGGGGTYPGATSPYTISGGLNKNTTYYIQILSDGTCASPIIPVKTEDVELDIVEWKTDSIVVDINTNETVGVTLENEVSYGTGLGSLAEDLFFSKYFEGSGSLKMIAIYNGTGKDVDLTDYFIYKGHNGSANFDEDDQDKISYPLSELGVIKQGQEIVLYSWPLNTDAEASVYSCSQTFLHSIANESGQDANPRWILCGKAPTNSITPIYSDAMNFNGDDPLLLYKDGEIIDVFGATDGESPENNVICDGYNENGNYKTRSDESWVANDVSNMDYGKTAEDFPNGEIPDDVNVDDPTITAYTARVIMFRKNSVTSGANAVTKNTNDFHTFAEEWEVRQVCRISGDGDLTCAAYQELGTFDYSDYYTKYVPMDGGTSTFDENDRNSDGTVTISIPELYKRACSNIRVKLTNSDGEVLTDREYKVPIMITTPQGTDGQAFLDLQQNLATVEVDGEGNVIKTYPLSLDEVREICKTCDVVIRDNATLTKVTDGTTNDHPQVRDVMIYEGASLEVDGANHNYTINSLSLRRKGDIVASAKVEEGGKLHLPASATAPIYLDMRVDANNWHWFTLPYNCNIADVTWVDGTPAQYNKDWFIMYYDGNSRANEQSIYENHWKVYNGTTIEAGKGYIVGIQGDITHPNHTFELRFPMATEVLTNEHVNKTVAVNAWGVNMDITPNKKGWNLVGNPYLDYYKTSENISFTGLSLIEYLGIDPVTGERLYQKGGTVPFLVTPVDGGWYEYQQELASDVEMMPFTAYFVQVGDPANASHTDGMELHAEFVSDHRGRMSLIRRAPQEVDGEQEPVIVRVEVANAKGESDKTTLIIDDRFTNEYEMNADFFKWFGDYYRRYTKPVLYSMGADAGKRAFNALSEQLAAQPIPLGMFAAQAGDYIFTLTRKRCDLSRVEEVWLYDATTATYTNLMQQDYTFTTAKTEGEGRFYLSVKMKQKTPTAVENVNGNLSLVAHQQTLVLSGLPAEAQVWVYDATGKLLHSEHTTAYQRIYPVQQAGVYFVSVKGQGDAQTLSTIVK